MRSEIYWIEGSWPGRLAIMPRPRGGDWLADEIHAYERARVNVLVSMLVPSEDAEFELEDEAELSRAAGIEFHSFPIPDRDVPESDSIAQELIEKLADALRAGRNVALHCRQGIGRASTIAAGVLILLGLNAETAISRIESARGRIVPETPEQQRWIEAFAKRLHLASARQHLPIDQQTRTGDNSTRDQALPHSPAL